MLGAALVSLGALLVLRRYLQYLECRLKNTEAIVDLFVAMERGITHSLKSPEECLLTLQGGILFDAGVAQAVKEGKSLGEAFDACSEKMLLPEAARSILDEELLYLGNGYLEGELKRVRGIIERLRRVSEEEKTKRLERGRVAGAVLFAAVSGIVLFLA